jgi:hypothetical protein
MIAKAVDRAKAHIRLPIMGVLILDLAPRNAKHSSLSRSFRPNSSGKVTTLTAMRALPRMSARSQAKGGSTHSSPRVIPSPAAWRRYLSLVELHRDAIVATVTAKYWRPRPESNRNARICSPLTFQASQSLSCKTPLFSLTAIQWLTSVSQSADAGGDSQ